MLRQLTLLAGLHKTATTSIQQTCAANLPLLRAAGLDYPFAQFHGKWESNHTRLVNALFRREPNKHGLQSQLTVDDALVPGSQEQLRESFAATISDAQRLVLVAEGVSVLDEAELQVMRDWFEQRGWQLRVMCHVRHICGWFNSMVAQRVTGSSRMTVGAAIEEFRSHGSIIRGRIERLRKVFPDAEFYSHERAVQHAQGPVGFFFQNIGLPAPPQLQFVRANEGRSDCATRVLSIINEKFGPFTAEGGINASRLGGPAAARLLDAVGGASSSCASRRLRRCWKCCSPITSGCLSNSALSFMTRRLGTSPPAGTGMRTLSKACGLRWTACPRRCASGC